MRTDSGDDALAAEIRPLPAYMREDPAQFNEMPLATEDSGVLPFERMRWRDFERLNLAVAERCDSLRDPMQYGGPGEKQDGIDFVGERAQMYQAYQVRRLRRKPTAKSVRAAVEDFLSSRPLGATSFVLCTAQPANQRPVVDEVKRLRDEHPDLAIQIRGAERLTELLASHPDLVQRFFNEQYRAKFCGVPLPAATARATQEPTVEAILRGPIKALRLEAVLRTATSTTNLQEKAAAYRTLAERLEASPYRALGRRMREAEAEAIAQAGDRTRACELWLDVAAEMVETGLAPPGPGALHRVRDTAAGQPEYIDARLQAVDGLVMWHRDGPAGIEQIRGALDRLSSLEDGWASRVCLWWAECCLVDEFFDAVREAEGEMAQAIEKAPSEDVAVRLRLSLADVTGAWDALEREARVELLSPANAGLVFCRRGRILAWTGDGVGAIDTYRQAVEPLMRDHYQGDVRACLESIRRIQWVYRPIAEFDETMSLLTTVTSGRRRFGEMYDARRVAVESLQAEEWASAHDDVRRFLWESRVAGHLEDELRARRLLGDLYARVGEPAAAMANYLRTGDSSAAGRMAKELEEPMNVLPETQALAPWLRASALAVVGVDGMQRSSQDALELARSALAAIHARPASPVAPQVWQEAFAALAGVAIQLNAELGSALMDLVAPLIIREGEHYRPIDRQVVAIVTSLYESQPALADRTRVALCDALGQSGLSDRAAEVVIEKISQDEALLALVEKRASHGDTKAAFVLAVAQIAHPAAIAYAEERIAAFLSAPVQVDPTILQLRTDLGLIGGLARLLGAEKREEVTDALLNRARVTGDLQLNRGSALLGLGFLADRLPDLRRDALFADILALADPEVELSPFDQFATASNHPLSRTRIRLGNGDLRRSALLSAACFVRNQDQLDRLRPHLRELLLSPAEQDLNAAARMLLTLEPVAADIVDVRDLANHPSVHLRAVAAWMLTHGRASDPGLCRRVATDTDESVRRSMAIWLHELEERDAPLADELRAVLARDKSARVRLAVVQGRQAVGNRNE